MLEVFHNNYAVYKPILTYSDPFGAVLTQRQTVSTDIHVHVVIH